MITFFNSSGGFRGIKDLYEAVSALYCILARQDQTTAHNLSYRILGYVAHISATGRSQTSVLMAYPLCGNCRDANKNSTIIMLGFREPGGKRAVSMGRWKAVRLKAMEGTYLENYMILIRTH